MSTEKSPTNAAEPSAPGPTGDEQNAAGQHDPGVDDGGPDSGEGGENPPSTDNTHTDNSLDADDGDDALTKALMSGTVADLDDNGEAKPKPKDEKPDAKPKDEPQGDDAADKEAAEPGPDDHTAEEKELIAKAPTKRIGKELDTLFKERREMRKQHEEASTKVKELEPAKKFADALIAHATEAGLVADREGMPDYTGLQTLLEQEKHLRSLPPEEVAAYYRKLADDIAPQAKPVAIPQDLADLVELQQLTQDEAQAIAERREAAKAPAKKPPAAAKPPEKPPAKPAAKGPTPQQQQAAQAGFAAIAKVAAPFKERFKSDWQAISDEVMKRVQPRLAKSDPSVWAETVQSEIELAVERRRTAIKKPPTTPRPGDAPPKRGDDVMTEAEEREALAKGRL